jgi:hypothetical protein
MLDLARHSHPNHSQKPQCRMPSGRYMYWESIARGQEKDATPACAPCAQRAEDFTGNGGNGYGFERGGPVG